MEALIEWSYLGLFIATFLAGTIVPFSSEIVLAGLLAAGADPGWCLASATAGNFLGGMTCYWIGHLGNVEWIEKYLHVSHEKLQKALNFLHGKGALMAFFTFLPFIGDPMAIGLGFMRSNFWLTAAAMFTGKFIRFVVSIQLSLGVIGLF